MRIPLLAMLIATIFFLTGVFWSGYLLLDRLLDGAQHSVGVIILPIAVGTLCSLVISIGGMFSVMGRD